MAVLIQRGHITFDATASRDFRQLVRSTLENSEFIDVKPVEDSHVEVIREVEP